MKLKNISVKLTIIFIIAFLARLIALNQSLWLDEGVTARVVQQYSIPQIISQFSPGDFHPPLFYILEKIWTSVFGYSEVALRFPSLLFSLITGWIVFKIGKFLKDETTGLWAALFFLYNPLIMYYSQEARMYMMVTCFLTAALYFFVRILKKSSTKDVVFFNIFIFLSFLTFYGSIFLITAMYFYLIWHRKYKEVVRLLPGIAFSVLVVSPLLFLQLKHSREALLIVVNWSQVLGTANFKNLYQIPIKFVTGRVSWDPKILYYAVGTVWSAFVFFIALKNFRKYGMFVFLLLFPLLLGLIFSVFSPLLQYFRFLYLIIPLSILLGSSLAIDWQKWTLLTGLLLFSFMYLLIPQYHREDWKQLVTFVRQYKTIYAVPSSMDIIKYYDPAIYARIHDIRNIDKETVYGEIAILPYTAPLFGIDYRAETKIKGYDIIASQDFRGVGVEIWQKKQP